MTNLFLVLLFCPCLSKKKSGLHLIYQHLENAFSVIILPLVRRKMETTFRNIDNAKMFTQLNSYKLIFKLLLQHKINNRTIIFATHNRYFANMADCKIELIDGKMKIINGRIS